MRYTKMDAKKMMNGMMLLTLFIVIAGSACYALPSAATGTVTTTLVQRQTPTNVVLDYDSTRVDSNLSPGDSDF